MSVFLVGRALSEVGHALSLFVVSLCILGFVVLFSLMILCVFVFDEELYIFNSMDMFLY